MKTQFEKTLEGVRKSLRMWETWKLQAKNLDIAGKEYSTWITMSKYDQDFNLVWNEIRGDCQNLSLSKLQKVMDFVRTL